MKHFTNMMKFHLYLQDLRKYLCIFLMRNKSHSLTLSPNDQVQLIFVKLGGGFYSKLFTG